MTLVTETIALWPSIKPTWVLRSRQNTARPFDRGIRKRPVGSRHHSALRKTERGRCWNRRFFAAQELADEKTAGNMIAEHGRFLPRR